MCTASLASAKLIHRTNQYDSLEFCLAASHYSISESFRIRVCTFLQFLLSLSN